ncbi:MAG: hypothetical protein NWP91_05440 [Rickettsiaceae bacterium]|nr:hypothetical protein [Rickettsiaceae bacterium]MDP5083400.1 hypothetical protein [Rickettsiaceae bacterium]
MKNFIKDNIVLIFGISLPIILVIIFILASTLPKYFVATPQYDFIFSDSQRNNNYEFVVINQKIHFRVFPARSHNATTQHLYRYVAATGKVQEITFIPPNMPTQKISKVPNSINANIIVSVDPQNLPSEEQARDTSKIISKISDGEAVQSNTIPVTELMGIEIDSSIIAPDGYKFVANNSFNHGGILFPAVSSKKNEITIDKNGRKIPIIYNNHGNVYYHDPIFIGWIIP